MISSTLTPNTRITGSKPSSKIPSLKSMDRKGRELILIVDGAMKSARELSSSSGWVADLAGIFFSSSIGARG